MGHCVGSYCEDVAQGGTRIFSLKDAKGEPHVTVEVGPGESILDPTRNLMQRSGQEIAARDPSALKDYAEYFKKSGEHSMNYAKNFMPWFRENRPELYEELTKQGPPKIVQIKGKQNRATNEEYLPFVQDFVRNSPLGSQWSEVGDLKNTGLHKLPDKRFITNEQLSEALQRIDPEGLVAKDPQWLLNQLNRDPKWWENAKGAFEGFAQGGLVEQNHWPFTTHLNSTRI